MGSPMVVGVVANLERCRGSFGECAQRSEGAYVEEDIETDGDEANAERKSDDTKVDMECGSKIEQG